MMLCQSVEEILIDDLESVLKRPASEVDYIDIFKVQVVLMYEWLLRLEEFNAIENPCDKSKMLQSFALRYMLLDNVFHAVELGISDRIVLVNNTFISPGQAPDIVCDDNENSRTLKDIMYGQKSVQLIDELIAPMISMNFTIGEMMALRLIMFWNPSELSLSLETKNITRLASDRAVNELHRWYFDQNFKAVDTRLGNDHVKCMTEMVKLIPSFGTLSERDVYLEKILNS
ncbi:unnamed protein product [Thelazia callipaeda]|uniref:NR LBD domain-containing protein n=1 Tax=Thelazia callipaeda TaxID=103827 RepID=A0A0N5CXG2_THECL|nr:unnamed protein product [Thelazia callipaeda]